MIDVDVHCAPASLQSLSPYLSEYWRGYIESSGVRLPTFAYPPSAATSGGPPPASYDELAAALLVASDPQFLILNCLATFEAHRHSHYVAALARAVNDWLAEEWLERDPRLRASIVVSTVDVDDAVAEIERVGDHPQFVQVLLPVRADAPWGNRRFHPLLAAAAARDLVVGLHAWGHLLRAPTPSGMTHTHLENYLNNAVVVQSHLLSLVCEGAFERIPTLRVALLECGFAWLPPLLWRADKDWKGIWLEVPWVTERPSRYVPRHFRFSTAPAPLPDDLDEARELLAMVGPDLLMYASDHPHRHGRGAAQLEAALDGAQLRAFRHDTAAEFYKLADRSPIPTARG